VLATLVIYLTIIKNLTTIKKKIRKNGKNEKRNLSGTRIDHMTERKRRQNLAPLCKVLHRFIAKLNESMKTARK